MNVLESRLQNLDHGLYTKFEETKQEVSQLLQKYASNFPSYTDHSTEHTLAVFQIASELLGAPELDVLNADEIYILAMACLLHDIGMCIPEDKILTIADTGHFKDYRESRPNLNTSEFIRDIHHELSNKLILAEWEMLKIPNEKYAKAIGLVAEGHRKVDLGNFDVYETRHFVKSGMDLLPLSGH